MCLAHQLARNFDASRSEAFAERLVNTLNEGALCLMISVGHRTGLFSTLARIQAGDSHAIAEAAGLQERYVREWLAAMTTARVVEYDPEHGTYRLPPEHAAFLGGGERSDNIAVFAQYLPVMAGVEDEVVECFSNGGGVPYERYRNFHRVMAEDSAITVLSSLFDHILPLAPGLVERLEAGIEVLDAGCGSGRAVNLMAERFPASRFTGYDLSPQAIEDARREAAEKGLANARFEVRDLSDFDASAEPGRFDLVTTFDAVHDQARPLRLLRGVQRALKADGVYLMQDIHASSELHNNLDHPIGTLLYAISTMHCMTVSLAQGGEGLGTMWGRETALELLHEAGFGEVRVHRLEHDFQNDYYVIRKP